VLEAPDSKLKNLVGEMFLATTILSFPFLVVAARSSVEPEVGRWTWLLENRPRPSNDKPRVCELVLRGVGEPLMEEG
jgi:hypothetical protein